GGPSKPAPGSPAARAQKYEAQVREHIAALSPQPPIPPTAPSVVAGHIADIIKKVPPELRAQVVHDVQSELNGLARDAVYADASSQKSITTSLQNIQRLLPPKDAKDVGKSLLDAQVRLLQEPLTARANAIDSAKSTDDKRKAVVDAAAALKDIISSAPPALRGVLLKRSQAQLDKIVSNLTPLSKDDTRKAIASLAAATDSAGALNAHYVSDAFTRAYQKGDWQQKGDDSGLFGQNKHNSEREIVDAFRRLRDDNAPGGDLLSASVVQGLMDKGSKAMAGAIATGKSDQVPDDTFAGNLTQLDDHIEDAIGEAVDWVKDKVAGALRSAVDAALHIKDNVKSLNSPGDSVTLAVGGEVGLVDVSASAEASMTITKTEDGGYELKLDGKASAGIFGNLPLPGFGGASGSASAGGEVSATFKFQSADDVAKAADTIASIGVATAAAGPVGTLVSGLVSGDELSVLKNHFTQGYAAVNVNADVKAELAQTAGLGAGGDVHAGAQLSVGVVWGPGKPATLELSQNVSADGSLNLGAPLDLGHGVELSGKVSGKLSLSATTDIPLDGVSLRGLISDPLRTLKSVGNDVLNKSTTTFSVSAQASGGAALAKGAASLEGEDGIELNLSGSIPTRQFADALAAAATGDFDGALRRIGKNTQLDVSVDAYKETGFKFDLKIDDIPGIKVDLNAQDTVNDQTELTHFQGTPVELARRGLRIFA
ncbi:MAG: hypothetical protein ACJ8AT_14150, partial [Hyalangium sp.]|uniref:hypothetical protein n=1 Tax=Hyalangium sp. TaxID=2028555 RepID=UPI003899EFA9